MTGLVFRFSLRQQIESKSFRTIAILMALLCLFLPMILLPALDRPEDSIPTSTDIQTAYCVDLTDYEPLALLRRMQERILSPGSSAMMNSDMA